MRIGETLYSVYPCRIRANSELSEVARGNGSAVGLSDAAESLRLAIANLPELWAGRRYRQFATFLEIQSRLLDWRRAILEAEADADRYLRSAKLAARNLHTELRTESDNDDVLAIASSITGLSDVDEMPLPMAAEERPRAVWPDGATSQERTHQICVAFTSFMLDGQPFKEPQTIEPGILRDLGAEVNISRWPDDAVSLVLEPLSIEPNGTYELPTFVFNRPAATPPLRLEQVGRIVVRSPTSALARPLEFAYRARSIPETCGAL
jgi:hypothetical protein